MSRILVLGLAIALLCTGTAAASSDATSSGESIINDSQDLATSVTISFSQEVRILWYDEAAFPVQEPSDKATSFTFSGGELPSEWLFSLRWVPSSAFIDRAEWNQVTDFASFSLDRESIGQIGDPVSALASFVLDLDVAAAVEITASLPSGLLQTVFLGNLNPGTHILGLQPLFGEYLVFQEPGVVEFQCRAVSSAEKVMNLTASGSILEPDEAVMQAGRQNLEQLQAQIDAAAPGASVEVPSGLYLGDLLITAPVVLTSQPEAVLVGTISIGIWDDTIPAEESDDTVTGDADTGTGDDGTDTGDSGTGTGSSAIPSSSGTIISGLTLGGSVVIQNASSVTLTDMSIWNSPTAGITATSSSVTVTDTTIVASEGPAISASVDSSVVVEENSFSANLEGDYFVDPGSTIQDTTGEILASDTAAGDSDVPSEPASNCNSFAQISLDRESIGYLGDPPSELANVVVSLDSDAQVTIMVDFPDGCTKQLYQGDLGSGVHIFSLAPVIGDCLRSMEKDRPFAFHLHAVRADGCAAEPTVEAYMLGINPAAATCEVSCPTAPGTRVKLHTGGTVSIPVSEPFYVSLNIAGGDLPCSTAPEWQYWSLKLYINDASAPLLFRTSDSTCGACSRWCCAWISAFDAYALEPGVYAFRGIFNSSGGSVGVDRQEFEVTVEVTE